MWQVVHSDLAHVEEIHICIRKFASSSVAFEKLAVCTQKPDSFLFQRRTLSSLDFLVHEDTPSSLEQELKRIFFKNLYKYKRF